MPGAAPAPVVTSPAGPSGAALPPADFGSPPSGTIPILFNDRHVYTKPDRLRAGRVLAALVRGNTILIPLRSMFEQMGATVSYDPASRTATVSKPGSEVRVTVGRPEVVVNGETRPLDVPPQIYQGSVLVPVRVISEGMGAYVQWVPDRKIVAVRYVAAPVPTPVPTAPPTAAPVPTTAPTTPPTPAPTPRPRYNEIFVAGDYIFQPVVYNEFSPGNHNNGPSYSGRAAIEIPAFGLPLMLEVDARQYAYQHFGTLDAVVPRNAACPARGEQGCVTTIGGNGSVYVPSFTAIDRDLDARLGFKVAEPRIYIAGSYLWRNTNYGYPQQHGVGFGIEKLPDLDQLVTLFGSYYYYPSVKGSFTDPGTGIGYDLQYRISKYQIGAAVSVPFSFLRNTGVFVEGGFEGDRGYNKSAAPADFNKHGFFAGIGLHF